MWHAFLQDMDFMCQQNIVQTVDFFHKHVTDPLFRDFLWTTFIPTMMSYPSWIMNRIMEPKLPRIKLWSIRTCDGPTTKFVQNDVNVVFMGHSRELFFCVQDRGFRLFLRAVDHSRNDITQSVSRKFYL